MCHKDDLRPGAYFSDHTTRKLYELTAQVNNVVKLNDAGAPLDKPRVTSLQVGQALQRLELVRAAPNIEDIASVVEFGPLG